MVVVLLVVALLLLLNALFVASEFAIIGAPRASVDRRAASGDATARTVRGILGSPVRQDRFIATAQLGITLASLGLGMYGEHAIAEWIAHQLHAVGLDTAVRWLPAHVVASVLAIGFITYLHVVVGEMVPKSLALMNAEQTVMAVARPMLAIQALFFPLVVTLNGIGNGLLRLVGVRREMSAGHYHTSEEIQHIVRESQEGGLLKAESGQVLRDLFEFGELTAGEAMVPRVRVVGLPVGADVEAIRAALADGAHTRYPVYEGSLDHIVGVVHIKDLLRLLSAGSALSASDVRPTAFLPETVELDRVPAAMREARTQLVVVMDEHGGTAGILSIEDLVAEAVGEVEEGPITEPEIAHAENGAALVAGTVRLDEVGDLFGRDLDHEEVDTVSGLVLAELERPPVVGDAVTYEGLRFEVVAVEGHGVERCAVTRLASDADDA